MAVPAGLYVLAGVLPGFVIDAVAPAVSDMVGAALPGQSAEPWFSLVPIAANRSSYNGLLIFVFIAASTGLAAWLVHQFGSRAFRRSAAWDCGFPDPSPLTQYSAGSFAQPIRRVFGSLVFRAREHVVMPAPGDPAPARFRVDLRNLAWEGLYAPVGVVVGVVAEKLNLIQFMTIRRYLSFVFVTLVFLLVVLAVTL
jgi:hypothetical protein